MTPHINAEKNAFAETVLLPGDPLRAQFIAENFLSNAKQVTNVRNMLGFTGEYQGKPISVMGSGMGIPSASIYATELIKEYGVRNLIRIGSAGALVPAVKIREIVFAMGACTDSMVNRTRFMGYDYSAVASYTLLERAVQIARKLHIPFHTGNCFSADLFYNPLLEGEQPLLRALQQMQVLCVEMEAAGLYGVAAEYGANALAILTISDSLVTHESLSSQDRQESFRDMMQIALDSVV